MKQIFFALTFICSSLAACTQSTSKQQVRVGGVCEGCEAIFESPVPFEKLSWTDTLPDFNEPGPKLIISGKIYKADGTPASGVILYVYHTDQSGRYTKKGNEKGWGLRHGYIRGWMKTNSNGEYRFYTLKPASYPDSDNPAHIHPVIKEPGLNEYWIDEYLFNGDRFLKKTDTDKNQLRGGNGVITLEEKNGILYGNRDIRLGLNIPGYPGK